MQLRINRSKLPRRHLLIKGILALALCICFGVWLVRTIAALNAGPNVEAKAGPTLDPKPESIKEEQLVQAFHRNNNPLFAWARETNEIITALPQLEQHDDESSLLVFVYRTRSELIENVLPSVVLARTIGKWKGIIGVVYTGPQDKEQQLFFGRYRESYPVLALGCLRIRIWELSVDSVDVPNHIVPLLLDDLRAYSRIIYVNAKHATITDDLNLMKSMSVNIADSNVEGAQGLLSYSLNVATFQSIQRVLSSVKENSKEPQLSLFVEGHVSMERSESVIHHGIYLQKFIVELYGMKQEKAAAILAHERLFINLVGHLNENCLRHAEYLRPQYWPKSVDSDTMRSVATTGTRMIESFLPRGTFASYFRNHMIQQQIISSDSKNGKESRGDIQKFDLEEAISDPKARKTEDEDFQVRLFPRRKRQDKFLLDDTGGFMHENEAVNEKANKLARLSSSAVSRKERHALILWASSGHIDYVFSVAFQARVFGQWSEDIILMTDEEPSDKQLQTLGCLGIKVDLYAKDVFLKEIPWVNDRVRLFKLVVLLSSKYRELYDVIHQIDTDVFILRPLRKYTLRDFNKDIWLIMDDNGYDASFTQREFVGEALDKAGERENFLARFPGADSVQNGPNKSPSAGSFYIAWSTKHMPSVSTVKARLKNALEYAFRFLVFGDQPTLMLAMWGHWRVRSGGSSFPVTPELSNAFNPNYVNYLTGERVRYIHTTGGGRPQLPKSPLYPLDGFTLALGAKLLRCPSLYNPSGELIEYIEARAGL